MHILYIHQHFSTPKGPTATRSYEFAKRLVAAGHEVTMICGVNALANTQATTNYVKGVRVGEVEGFKVIEIAIRYSNYDNLWTRIKKFFFFSVKSSQLALKLEYDLIFTTSTPLTVAIPGILAKWFCRKKFVFEVRDLWPDLPKAMGVKNPLLIGGMALLEKCAYRSANALVGLSPGIVEGIRRIVSTNKNVAMIPNGCDIELFNSIEKQALEGCNSEDFIAVFAGAHGLANGLDAVLDVAKLLQERNVNHIKFLLIGDGKLKPQLIERARKEKLDNCIFWDPIPKVELIKLLKSVNLGLMILQNIPAFYYGTSPNKFFDYLAAGLPVLNNYPGWLADLITEHRCGVAVKPDNPEDFANVLVSLSADRAKLEAMKNNTKLLALEFDRSKLANDFVRFLESVHEKSN